MINNTPWKVSQIWDNGVEDCNGNLILEGKDKETLQAVVDLVNANQH